MDLDEQIKQLVTVLKIKENFLIQEIEAQQVKGVTDEEIQEFDQTFCKFDPNNTGRLDKRQVRACLFAVGEELLKSETNHLLAQFGNGSSFTAEQFRNAMIFLHGVAATQEKVTAAFQYLANDQAVIGTDKLRANFEDPDVQFMLDEAASGGGGGGDIVAFVPVIRSCFAR